MHACENVSELCHFAFETNELGAQAHVEEVVELVPLVRGGGRSPLAEVLPADLSLTELLLLLLWLPV